MELQNLETKAIVEAVKNEDGTYLVEGQTVKKEDMAVKYGRVKPKVEKEKEVNVIESIASMSDTIGNLGKALSECQGEFTAVTKGTKAFNYNYADLEAVLNASRAITSKYELAIVQLNLSKVVGDNLLVGVKTILTHSSGEYIASEIYVPAIKSKSNTLVQMAGVNITYLRRYGIQSILGLATKDTDGV
jgi:hypothetical protein